MEQLRQTQPEEIALFNEAAPPLDYSANIAAFLAKPPPSAYYAACQILRNYEDAHEAVAQAVALAWEHAGEYRGDGSFEAWFFMIVRNVSRMEVRRRMRGENERDEVIRRTPAAQTPESRLIKRDQERRLAQAVRNLPKPYRDAVRFVYYDGLRQEDAAERMGISCHAMKSRMHRAKRILEERLCG